MNTTTKLSAWPDDERDRKRAPMLAAWPDDERDRKRAPARF
ncbi:MAG: hypothetical protein QM740_00360 [Acidovorax sp.]